MSYSNHTKLVCKFDSVNIIDEKSAASIPHVGNSPSVVPAKFGLGLQMTSDSYLTTNISLSIVNTFTIGFWLKPINPGLGNDGTAAVSLKQPILSKSGFSVNGITGQVTLSSPSFMVYEETQ